MGKVTFGELAYWLLTLQRPTFQQARLFEAVLIGLADHGFTPTAIAARLTYLSAPDAIQGALAAGILGGGSRFLGVTEDTGRIHPKILGRTLPLNGAGVSGAALADLGLPLELLRGTVLLARCAGLLGHLAEEIRRPIGESIYLTVDRNATYITPGD